LQRERANARVVPDKQNAMSMGTTLREQSSHHSSNGYLTAVLQVDMKQRTNRSSKHNS
jgi:hypothetical protein